MSIQDLTPAVGTPQLLWDVPDCDQPTWKQIDRDERVRVRELWAAFKEMRAARTLKAGAMSAAIARAHLGWGWSAKALLNLYRAYTQGGHKPGDYRKIGPVYRAGDWRILLRTYSGFESSLPEEFKRWVCEQWSQFHGRSDVVAALWRHVVYEVWLKGQPVPGYGTVDEWCLRAGRARPHPLLLRPGELPDGWSEDTFRRLLPKRRATREQAGKGYLAAHAFQPDQVLGDRRALMPLQYVPMDDHRGDCRVVWSAGSSIEIVYPLLVMGLDAATGVDVANVAKPRALQSPEAESADERKVRHGVTQDMADLVVIRTLAKFGLPPWPITFVHENAAACVSTWLKHALHELFGDRVQFEATSIFTERMYDHGFTASGGAPYDKASMESFWRLLETQGARLAGATGPRYDTQPPELKEVERYTLALVQRAGGLAEVVQRLAKPLPEFSEWHAATEDALRLFRFRTNHKLQGFDYVREWRRSPQENYQPWETYLALSAAEQDAIAKSDDKHALVRRLECPAERFCRLLQGVQLTPIDPDVITWLEGPRFPVTIRNGKVTIDRAQFGNDPLVFRETDHPLLVEEYEGRTFEAAVASDASRIVLTHEGRFLGSVAQQGRVNLADRDALHREQGRVRAARVQERERFAGYYLADQADAVAQLRAHNDAVIASAPELQAGAPVPQIADKSPRLTATQRRRNAQRGAQLAAAAQAAAGAATDSL